MTVVDLEKWEPVIGLEVHAQLLTQAKVFSRSPVRFGAPPNTLVDEVCAGLPGTLPVLNRRAVELALRAGFALNCTLNQWSQFARKNYFYPDLPKGYQISQFDHPLFERGWLEFPIGQGTRRCGITRVHMEEDTGKSHHEGDEAVSHIDLNRAGTPLIEIVFEPEIRTGEEASSCFRELRAILIAIGANDGAMAEGSLRCDANVSVRHRGETSFGTKVEVKNINSFKFVREAIAHEITRQITELESGGRIWQETRLWNDARKCTLLMRRKEGSADYRYFPEPDLPPLVIDDAWAERVRGALPELPAGARERLQRERGLSPYDATVLVAAEGALTCFDAAVAAHGNAKGLANLLVGPLQAAVNEGRLTWSEATRSYRAEGGGGVDGRGLAELQALVDDGTVSNAIARQVLDFMIESGGNPRDIVDAKGLRQTTDTSVLEAALRDVAARSQKELAAYRGGKVALLGFFVGQVMKATGGKANPKVVNEFVRTWLDRGDG